MPTIFHFWSSGRCTSHDYTTKNPQHLHFCFKNTNQSGKRRKQRLSQANDVESLKWVKSINGITQSHGFRNPNCATQNSNMSTKEKAFACFIFYSFVSFQASCREWQKSNWRLFLWIYVTYSPRLTCSGFAHGKRTVKTYLWTPKLYCCDGTIVRCFRSSQT